jgi:class 3 adenylate cyclase
VPRLLRRDTLLPLLLLAVTVAMVIYPLAMVLYGSVRDVAPGQPPRSAGMADYLKEAFLFRWNLLFVVGGAAAAALTCQRALQSEAWPDGVALRVRMAIHIGEAELRDGDPARGLASPRDE